MYRPPTASASSRWPSAAAWRSSRERPKVPDSVLGNELAWKVKVDGKTTVHVKQGFGAHYVYRRDFAANSGRHVVKVFKNDVLVRTGIVR
jgi:hypothetical protein